METLSKKQEQQKTTVTPGLPQRDPRVATVVELYRDELQRRERKKQGNSAALNGEREERIRKAINSNPVVQRRAQLAARRPNRDFASSPELGIPIQRQPAIAATIAWYKHYLQTKTRYRHATPTHQPVQAKLQISQPHDPAEIEADSVSEQIMRMPDVSVYGNKSKNLVRRHAGNISTKQPGNALHRSKGQVGSSAPAVNNNLASQIQGLNGKGQPLPEKTRNEFEGKFGHSFENVRVHTNSESARMAQSINARAFTTGNNIVFGEGQYNTDSSDGKKLLAHELTHTVQQGASVKRAVIQRDDDDDSGKAGRLTRRINNFAKNVPGFELLSTILGRNPITNERVPQHAKAYVRAFLVILPNGEATYKKLDESGAIDRALTWLKAKVKEMDLSWPSIKAQLKVVWDSVSLWKVHKWGEYVRSFITVLTRPAKRLIWFGKELLKKAAEFAFMGFLKMVGAPVKTIMGILRKTGSAIGRIFADPKTFFKNLGTAVKSGFNKFKAGIWGFLKQGLFSWLFGAFSGMGISFPKQFNLKGIFHLLAQIFGVTYQVIRTRLVKRMGSIGEMFVGFLEKGFDVVKTLITKGPIAIWEKLKESLGNLKEMFFGAIIGWLRNTIIVKALSKIVLMLNPAGAIVTVVKGIVDVVMFFVNNWKRIADFVNSIFNSLNLITLGKTGNAAQFILGALVKSVPIVISFLARFLGLSGIVKKVTGVIDKIKKPIDNALGKAIGWIAQKGGALFAKVKGITGKVLDKLGLSKWFKKTKPFKGSDQKNHKLFFRKKGNRQELMVASEPHPVDVFLTKKLSEIYKFKDSAKRSKLLDDHQKASGLQKEISTIEKKLQGIEDSLKRKKSDSLVTKHKNTTAALQSRIDSLALYLKELTFAKQGEFPPAKLPVFSNHTKSSGTKTEYLHYGDERVKSGGESSTQHKGNLLGWTELQAAGLTTGKNKWVKMHMLHHELGGKATDSNLVPAPENLANKPFKKIENKALRDAEGGKMVWYDVTVDYHSNTPYPSSMTGYYGYYKKTNNRWERDKTEFTLPISSLSLPNLNGGKLKINLAPAKSIRDFLGITGNIASAIGSLRKNGHYNTPQDLINRLTSYQISLPDEKKIKNFQDKRSSLIKTLFNNINKIDFK